MALQRVKLADIQYIAATTAASIYSNPSSTKTLVTGLILFNGNTTTETVKLYVVPDSGGSVGTAGVSNQVMQLTLTTMDTLFVEFPFGVMLTDTNDSIQASTTTASKVTVIVTGDQIT